jgi:hypothetical protein
LVLRNAATRSGTDARHTEQIMTMPRVTIITVLLLSATLKEFERR